jgi:hypothetical protein
MKTKIISGIFACLLVAGVALLGVVSAGGARGAYKLEGAWVARVVENPVGWSAVFAPDASGRRATGHAQFDVGPVIPDLGFGVATKDSHIFVELEMTGRDSAAFMGVWYGIKEPSTIFPGLVSGDIVYIGVDKGELTFETPDRLLGIHTIEYYVPSQDADGDGYPDPGQAPVYSTEIHSVNTRLPGP